MKIREVFQGRCPVSFEVFPPKGELTLSTATDLIGQIATCDPAFVSVTYSAGGSGNSHLTAQIAHIAQERFGLNAIAHLTCMGATHNSIAAHIARMRELKVENVLALRGDPIPGSSTGDFSLARDLIPTLREAGFCVGAAAYPEGHIDCLNEFDNVHHLKQKQDAGAEFFITQLFFDNRFAYRFLDLAHAAGVTAPISFGVMPFLSKSQATRMVFMCGASLPAPLVKLLARYEHDPASLRQAGIEYACNQIDDLVRHGVDGVHVYTMNRPDIAQAAATVARGRA
ncbi:methylenetetrahydrofolate reductase [NAD(P)H] [Eggerthellaceae bacterium zg-1084]|uniref:methylenetetrahydrofolate reductase n=1 Tax=Berryella wangjianweii TaxID=2734634 RepID=UPI0015533B15|nr:methylenetetrahydrofolate reductase [Berryella wangjianweii]NPD30433.1 methylenetetrahydrofolate reductase [NAD(P)H] [Berryella wangjianweii]